MRTLLAFTLCLLVIPSYAVESNATAIARGRLSSNMDGNRQSITNLATIIGTNGQVPFVTAPTNAGTDGQVPSKTGDKTKWTDASSFSGNANQFSGSGTVSIKSGALLTNVIQYDTETFRSTINGSDGVAIDGRTGDILANGDIVAQSFAGDGSQVTALNASQITSGTIPQARLGNALTNSAVIYVYTNGTAWGPNGAIDTTGSKTAAIQEALNALPTTSLTTAFAGGGEIRLAPGIYYVTNTITIPNAGAFNLTIKGSGKVNTIIKYVGTTTDVGGGSNLFNTAVDSVIGPPGACSLNAKFDGIGFSHVKFNNYANLLGLSAINELDVESCGFFTEQVLTNGGSSLNYTPSAATTACGTIGVYASGCNMFRVRNSSFWGTAYGLFTTFTGGGLGGHTRVENCIFDGVKTNTSKYAFWAEPVGGYSIPSSAAVVNVAQDCIITGCQYDGCTIAEYSVGTMQTVCPVYENVTINHVVDGSNGGTIECISPNVAMSVYAGVERKMATDGTMGTPVANSIVVYGNGVIGASLWSLTDAGTARVNVDSAGALTANGSGLTSLNASSLASGTVGAARLATANTFAIGSSPALVASEKLRVAGNVSVSGSISNSALTANRVTLSDGSTVPAITSMSAGTSGQVLHGNASGPPTFGSVALATDVSGTLAGGNFPALSGDISTTAGSLVTTIGNNKVTGAMIALGSDAQGDIMYYDGTDYVRLPKSTDGKVLTLASSIPSWATPSGGGGAASDTTAWHNTADSFGSEKSIGTGDGQPFILKANAVEFLRGTNSGGNPSVIAAYSGTSPSPLDIGGRNVIMASDSATTVHPVNSAMIGCTTCTLGGGGSAESVILASHGGLNSGTYSLTAGNRARNTGGGTFTFADGQDADFTTSISDMFNVRAQGGVRFELSSSTFTNNGIFTNSGMFSVGGAMLQEGTTNHIAGDQRRDGGLYFPTNMTRFPNFNKPWSLTNVGAAYTMGAPAGVDTTLLTFQQTLYTVTNTSGAAILVTLTQPLKKATWWGTNVTAFYVTNATTMWWTCRPGETNVYIEGGY